MLLKFTLFHGFEQELQVVQHLGVVALEHALAWLRPGKLHLLRATQGQLVLARHCLNLLHASTLHELSWLLVSGALLSFVHLLFLVQLKL